MIKKILLALLSVYCLSYGKTIELTGTVISDNEKYITSRFMGFVKLVNVNEGDIVNQGDILYEIDSTEINNKKEQALLSVQMYQNQYDTVHRNYERYKRLYKDGVVSKFELEQLELNSRNSKNMVKISESRVKEVKNQYQYLEIKAPNSGVITKKMIKAGEMAVPGIPAMILTDLSNLKIKAEISENDLGQVSLNQKVNISIPSQKINTQGVVSAIIPSSNPMTHTFTIKISFPKNKKVYPGMYTKIKIDVN